MRGGVVYRIRAEADGKGNESLVRERHELGVWFTRRMTKPVFKPQSEI
jgi:hypothetical protein